MTWLDSLFGLAGKTALVTGGATGIGRMAAEGLVRAGAHVLIASRKGEACAAAAAELNALGAPGSAEGFAGDVAGEAQLLALAEGVRARTGVLHILMNNAGVTWGAPLEAFPHAQWGRVMEVNVAAPFTLTRALLPLLEAGASDDDPARVVNVGSIMGMMPAADGAYSYAASKAAVHHLTAILASELAGRRITVNALAPGLFPSRMTRFALADAAKAQAAAEGTPLGRLGRPDDIAGAMLFLCGRGGAYVSGAVLPIDGATHVQAQFDTFSKAR